MNTKKNKRNYQRAGKVLKDLKIQPSFGETIRSLRECDEITQVELARQIGVSRQFLSDVEKDRKVVGVEFAKKLSDAMGYPIETFLQPLINSQLERAGIKCHVEIASKAS
ncbi:MAG: helix-turn-helix transcriptional regulator [Bdellovibrionota bacterium]